MSKRKPTEAKARPADPPTRKAAEPLTRKTTDRRNTPSITPSQNAWLTPSSIRETVESVAIAFILAFLFRTFEAEAFVIPTGSMAPTLMGRHKDVECPECRFRYQVSASNEVDATGAVKADTQVESGTCPMCRFPADLRRDNPQRASYPSYSGDRILVGKFVYQFRDPRPWDVVVFKYPGDPTTNYIKRLVALPGETVYIHHGDLWIQHGKGPPAIARKKDPQKLLAMLQPVFDNDTMPAEEVLGRPRRWLQETGAVVGAAQWTSADGKAFQIDAAPQVEGWLRYHHKVPSYREWETIVEERRDRHEPKRHIQVPDRLVSDFYAYNTGGAGPVAEVGLGAPPHPSVGPNWVGDLALDCSLTGRSGTGQVIFDLVKGGRHFSCRIDFETGQATLAISGVGADQFGPAAPTAIKGPGHHRVVFANVDDQLRLIVDGREVSFGNENKTTENKATQYCSEALGTHVPQSDDLAPVGIGCQGASIEVSHIKVLRDVYYVATQCDPGGHPSMSDYKKPMLPDLSGPRPSDGQSFDDWAKEWFSNVPKGWWESENPNERDSRMAIAKLALAPANPDRPHEDQFLVLGDNSPQSKDSRLWDERAWDENRPRQYWVKREMLIGEALFIYWPHSWGQMPGPLDKWPLNAVPLWPNWRRMQLVR
jgi:signal peptidase I